MMKRMPHLGAWDTRFGVMVACWDVVTPVTSQQWVFTDARSGDGRSEIPSYHTYLVVIDKTPQCEQS